MKKFCSLFTILFLAAKLFAQTNEPVKLALISETDGASAASDLLTAQLSSDSEIHLLERDQIDRIYGEQGLSAANKDYLKMGRLLGADGLLLMQKINEGTNYFLNVRLIAVKPGVVLTAEKYVWPSDLTEWSAAFEKHLDSFLPKLTVLVKDAIPISIVDLRSAVQSDEASETETQLKLLTIQRFSQERQLFVLERQKMQSLSEEKELNVDDLAFWNGSYLLEGVVDQNGYSKDIITINARLTPPKGGAAVTIAVSGSRTNLAEVINQLAAKIIKALKINSTVKEWNAADEAAQYFDEAKWALKWKVYSEAQAAANSAWALGKRDLECAIVRVEAYSSEVLSAPQEYKTSEDTFPPVGGYDQNGKPLGPPISNSKLESDILQQRKEHPFGLTYQIKENNGAKTIDYIFADSPPDIKNINLAQHALELYYQFSRTLPDGQLKIDSQQKNSEWYDLGVETLVAASWTLQNFNLTPPEFQKPIIEKLAELRATARSVAKLISESPSVHDSYFVGDRVVTHDELANTIGEDGGRNPNIFSCEARWGCFWQETPEDCIALYRELMSSPAFGYIHSKFWFPYKYDAHRLPTARLVTWNDEDRKRLPVVWNNFVQELDTSTNLLMRMEGKAIALADSQNDSELETAFNGLFDIIFANRDVLVANNVELLYLDWGTGDLISEKCSSGISSPTKEKLEHQFNAEYHPKLEAMDQEYESKTAPAAQFASQFDEQIKYLKADKPYDFMEFAGIFGSRDYTKSQALTILPLITSYKSNLVAQAKGLTGVESAVTQVGFLENDVNRVLNLPAPKPQPLAQNQPPKPAATAKVVASPTSTNVPEAVTNIIVVKKFLAIPWEETLVHLDGAERIESSSATITAHHWFEGKLLLDFQYGALVTVRDDHGQLMDSRTDAGTAIAIFDPTIEHWKVIACPKSDEVSHIISQNKFYHRTVLFHGAAFTCDDKKIEKYDFAREGWETLKISDENNHELFIVNDRLYAANQNIIFEIVDDGNATQILASTRRHPAVSILDNLENLGAPTLFQGPNHTLRAGIQDKIYTWNQNDWQEDFSLPTSLPAEMFTDGVLFRTSGNFSDLRAENTSVDKWNIPHGLNLSGLAAALRAPDLYLLADHSEVKEIANDQHLLVKTQAVAKNGYHAELFCLSQNLRTPQKLFLKFENPDGYPPTTGMKPDFYQSFQILPTAWMLFSSNCLLFGKEIPTKLPPGIENDGIGYKMGIWLLPVSEFDADLTARKQSLLSKQTQQTTDFLAKYDLNHDGIIDPEEKEQALTNSNFIESELDLIDANQNGFLDAEELSYFDANTNKILDANEEIGIQTAQHLLAVKLLKQFDANGDGVLDHSEFNRLQQSIPYAHSPGMIVSMFPDKNHNGQLDLEELESFLKQRTQMELMTRRMPGMLPFTPSIANRNGQSFKAALEFYWQHAENPTDRLRMAAPSPAIQ
ncbi:MAG TPA: hypothetical protein VHG89_13440 [Verrucomicrobiae bacterium]|nr:hypothetical protein [Verrucomicrobiae bacterium]